MKTSSTVFAELQLHRHGSTCGCGIQASGRLRSCRDIDIGLHTDTTIEAFRTLMSRRDPAVRTLRIRAAARAVGSRMPVLEVPQAAAVRRAEERQQRPAHNQV